MSPRLRATSQKTIIENVCMVEQRLEIIQIEMRVVHLDMVELYCNKTV